jgi:carboxyl-terminal processing protease
MSIGKIEMDVNQIRTGLRTAVCALAMLAIAPATLAQRPHSTPADSPEAKRAAQEWNQAAKDKVLDRMSSLVLTQAYVPNIDFSKWQEVLSKIKPEAQKAKSEEEFAGIINSGLHDAFNISHIVLMPPRAVDERMTQRKVGIGIRINVVPEGVLVTNTIPGAPAEKAGIEPGDIIMEADGHKVEASNPTTHIAGDEGTVVVLKVKKNDGKTVRDYKVTRAAFKTTQKEELIQVDKDTAAIKIQTFDLSYDRDNVTELMKKAAGYKNLLIDLRNNGGGAVGNMMHFLSFVLPQGKSIGTFINKKGVDDFVEEKKGDRNDLKAIADFSQAKLRIGHSSIPVFKGKIAVLVNGGSGSASEISAEALRELLNAPIIGKKSAGAVLVSVMGELPHGFNLQYPISDYISTNHVRLESNGIVPDADAIDVPFVKKGQTDPAYNTALAALIKLAKAGN